MIVPRPGNARNRWLRCRGYRNARLTAPIRLAARLPDVLRSRQSKAQNKGALPTSFAHLLERGICSENGVGRSLSFGQAFCWPFRRRRRSPIPSRATTEISPSPLPLFSKGESIPGPGGMVISHSGNFDAVRFGASDIVLLNSTCEFDSNCFDATFLEDGIFQKTGTFFASDGDAKIVITESSAGVPVPEPSTWALLAVGLAGLGFARNRRLRGARPVV